MNLMAHSTAPACDSMTVFSENVLRLMGERGITMAALARAARVDRSSLHKSLNEQGGSFSLVTCDKIANALETSTSELISKK